MSAYITHCTPYTDIKKKKIMSNIADIIKETISCVNSVNTFNVPNESFDERPDLPGLQP